MIQRFANILLTLLLMVSTTGISITRHYCGNDLESVGLFSKPDQCCDMKGCCHDETSFHQLKEHFFSPDNSVNLQPFSGAHHWIVAIVVHHYNPVEMISVLFPVAKSPPVYNLQTTLSIIQSYRC